MAMRGTPPEPLTLQEIIDDICRDLIKSQKSKKCGQLLENVAVGELQTLDANSLCVKVPAGGYVVLLNTGLMILLHKSIKAFASRMTIQTQAKNGDHKPEKGPSLEETARYMYEIIATYISYNAPVGPMLPIESLSESQILFSEGLLHFSEMFVLAHEFGHILENHLSQVNVSKMMMKDREIDFFRPDWNQEYDADLRGLKLILETAEDTGKNSLYRALAYAGPDLSLTIFDLVDRISKTKFSSHPPARLRRKNLRKSVPTKDKGLTLARAFQKLADDMWRIISKRQ